MAAMSLSASAIPVFGVAWAVFWTGFLRVGAQSALLLAPRRPLLLVMRWLTWLVRRATGRAGDFAAFRSLCGSF